MYISVLAFSSFAYRKLKLGQNYQSAEKILHGYCFSSLCQFGHYLLHAYVYSCMHACQGIVFGVWRKTQ